MVSRDWAEQHIHECIVGSPCGFCPALNLGLRAIRPKQWQLIETGADGQRRGRRALSEHQLAYAPTR